MANKQSPVDRVIEFFGKGRVAEITGVSRVAVGKWERNGHFPHTDYSGKTNHAHKLAQASDGHFSVDDLLPQVSQLNTTQTKTPSGN